MVFYTSPWACVIIALILALHPISVFIKSIVSKICIYVNIGLHMALFLFLFFIGAEISELAVMFLGSLAVYISLSFLSSYLESKKSDREGEV